MLLVDSSVWINILRGKPSPMSFHWTVLLLILWSALQRTRWNKATP